MIARLHQRLGLPCLLFVSGMLCAQNSEPVTELERFITRESALERSGGLMQNSRPVEGLFGSEVQLVDLPRSVTLLSAESLEQFGIRSFADLGKTGAGTQQVNYYGMPGTPTLRGAKGSVYFNGMQRAYQRNEMPLSFGSAEAMDIAKGPAPAHFGPGMVGGFVNLIPKSPYFDKSRNSVQVTVGNDDLTQVQLDAGGATLLFGRPAAFRVSITGQRAASTYTRIRNDYLSVYAAVKAEIARDVTVFTGAEAFDFRSNENAGWNRPTQNLIDTGSYVVGEPIDVSSSSWSGYADRNAIAANPALVVPRALVDAGVSSGFITSAQRSSLNDLSTQAGRLAAYGPQSPYLGNAGDGYQYTSAYFNTGGKVFTTPISGSQVLSDERDYANSQNLLWFFDISSLRLPSMPVKSQLLLDWVRSDKLSSYGYAASTRQLVIEEKLSLERRFSLLKGMTVRTGVSSRFTDGKILQDYTLEPFGRRDITRSEVSGNSVILAGPQTGPDGLNFWSPTSQGGANVHSQVWQFTAFAHIENKLSDRLSTHLSLLAAHAPFRTENPSEVDRATAAQDAALKTSDHKNYTNISFSPVFGLTDDLNVYATIQRGTSLDATQGGAIFGQGNFARNNLDEAGLKADLFQRRLFASLSVFRWEQSQFDVRTLTPELMKGRGVEFELSAKPTDRLTLVASAGWQRVRRLKPLPFRAMPLSEQQWALYGGVLNSQFGPAYFNPSNGRQPAANPDLVYPGFPETQYKFFAHLRLPSGFTLAGGPVISSAFWHNFDHTLRLPSSTVWNAAASWKREKLSVRLELDNLFNQAYYLGAEPVFGANTLVTKAPGLQWRVCVGVGF